MTDDEIRKRYQREGGELGENQVAVTRFIDMLHAHEESDNNDVKTIVANIENLENIAPNFTIFQSDKSTFFMHQFSALQISTQSDDLVLAHEFGHGVLGMLNHVQVPENFEEVVKRAREHSLNPETKDKFIEFVQYLSDTNRADRTEAEKGPVSDIISSIFQYPAFTFKKINQRCVLPSFHDRDYYFDEERGIRKVETIFDEDFANYYALVANNCHKELEELRMLFGDEWMQVMKEELAKAAKTIEKPKEKPKAQIMDQIKSTIIGVPESSIPTRIEEKEPTIKNTEERE